MLKTSDILSTLRMFQEENLDVRTVTMGINLLDCADRSPETMLRLAGDKIRERAGNLVRVCDDMSARYGIPIVNKRLAISPASQLLEGHDLPTALALAKALDQAVADVGVDLLGGFSALVHKGITPGERILLKALPQVLAETTRICASINVGTTKAGINADPGLFDNIDQMPGLFMARYQDKPEFDEGFFQVK